MYYIFTICLAGKHHSCFMATGALGHNLYIGVPKCTSCHKADSVLMMTR